MQQPIALFFDDLHAADASSLLLLRFVAGALGDVPILIVGCYRDTEVDPELDEALVDLARHSAAVSLGLEGIDRVGVSDLLHAAMGTPPTADLVERVHDRTHGNPLFATEVGRLLASGGWEEEAVAGSRASRCPKASAQRSRRGSSANRKQCAPCWRLRRSSAASSTSHF